MVKFPSDLVYVSSSSLEGDLPITVFVFIPWPNQTLAVEDEL